MPTHEFLQVDAFTTHAASRTPCAIVMDSDELDVLTMQAIAREMLAGQGVTVIRGETTL